MNLSELINFYSPWNYQKTYGFFIHNPVIVNVNYFRKKLHLIFGFENSFFFFRIAIPQLGDIVKTFKVIIIFHTMSKYRGQVIAFLFMLSRCLNCRSSAGPYYITIFSSNIYEILSYFQNQCMFSSQILVVHDFWKALFASLINAVLRRFD